MRAFSFIAIFAHNKTDQASFPSRWDFVGLRHDIKEAADLASEWCARIPRQCEGVSVWQYDSCKGWRHVRTEHGLETIYYSFSLSAEPEQYLAGAFADALNEAVTGERLIQFPTAGDSPAVSKESLR